MAGILIYHPEAEEELVNAIDYYEVDYPGRGDKFLLSYQKTLEVIKANPVAYPDANYRNLRKAALSNFPYTIYYKVFEDIIYIHCVFHQSRSEKAWKSRL